MLLPSLRYRQQLEDELGTSRRGFFYSAFFTSEGAKWLSGNRNLTKDDRLLVRALPADFIAGACSFDAISYVLERGLPVRMSSALHAKVYAFDSSVFTGSANLTAKGLALAEDSNLEIGVKANVSSDDLELLDHLWAQAIVLDSETLVRMEDHIREIVDDDFRSAQVQISWPDDIVVEERDMYCSDFPQTFPSDDLRWSSFVTLRQTIAYKWLLAQVETYGEPSFGLLSSQLHNDVYDDPAPYRREIKELLSNLLEVVMEHDHEFLEVNRPRHRQIVRKRS